MSDREQPRWFGAVDLAGIPLAGRQVVTELIEMLDQLQPRLIDPGRSAIRCQGHGWELRPAAEIRLVHRTDDDATVEVIVDDREAIVSWLAAHEHLDTADGSPLRAWTSAVVDLTAAVLRGQYEVETTYRGSRPIKTRIIDTAGDRPGRLVSESGTFGSWLPSARPTRVTRQRLDYGTRHP